MSQRSPQASDLLDRRRFLPVRALFGRVRLAGLAWVALAVATVAPWPAVAQVSDDFSSPAIDLSKWQDSSSNVVRRLSGGKLESSVTKLGVRGASSLTFTNPGSVQSIQAEVTVTSATVVSPSASPGTNMRARLYAGFYNNGTPGAGSIGDIAGRIELRVDPIAPPGMARVVLAVDRCDDETCNLGPTLFFDTTTFGPVPIGSTHTLGVAWDGNQTFTFTFDTQPPKTFTTSEPVAGPAKNEPKLIGTRAGGVNASEGGSIRALFDDVMKNGVLYDDFSAATLDPAKWQNNQEFVKRNVGGVFELVIQRFGSAGSNNLVLLQPDLAATLAADVTVTAVRNGGGARPQARLFGQYFNSAPGGGQPGDQTGDIQAAVNIFDHENGSGLRAGFFIVRCLDPACATFEDLLNDDTTFGPVILGSTHRLSIGFDGARFTFGVDAQRVTVPSPVPNTGPARGAIRLIGTRIGNLPDALVDQPSEGGFVSATFDNFVGTPTPTAATTASGGVGGAPANGPSQAPFVSADGSVVAFVSSATNLVASGCVTNVAQVFVTVIATGTTTCVSVAPDGSAGGAPSGSPALSADGNTVVFLSSAANLGACPAGGPHVFVRDRAAGTTQCVSVGGGGTPADAPSDAPAIAGNASRVAFVSAATNLGACPGGGPHVFLRDLVANTTACTSLAPDGLTAGSGASGGPVLNGDGTVLAFHSSAGNLVSAGCTTAVTQVFRRALGTGVTTCLSVAPNGVAPGGGASTNPTITEGGSLVAFQSLATNLVAAGCTTGISQIFVRNVAAGTTTCASVALDGTPGNGPSTQPALSGDGRFIAFATTADNLPLVGQASGTAAFSAARGVVAVSAFSQIVRGSTAVQGAFERLSQAAGGASGNGSSERPRLDRTGAVAVFQSAASNLAANDTNGQPDVFVVAPTARVTLTAPLSGSTFALNTSPTVTIAWTALPGATDYLFEFTAAGGVFTNPNGTAPDPANAGGGTVVVPNTVFSAALSPAFPPGTYQVRVIGRNNQGQLVGSFSDAVALVLVPSLNLAPDARVTFLAPSGGAPLQRSASVTFAWTPLNGVVQYGFEFTCRNRTFANPNGTGPDGANGFGSLCGGGGFLVPATSFTTVLDAGIPPGTYQVRIIGLSPAGAPVGLFSDAVTVVIQ